MKIQLFPLLLLVPMTGQAAVYQCLDDGLTTFTDRPCAGAGHEVDMGNTLSVVGGYDRDFVAVNAGIRDRLAAKSKKREIKKLESKVRRSNKKIGGYRAQMNRELSWVRPADEHAAIRGYWDSRVSDQVRSIAGYQREIDALGR